MLRCVLLLCLLVQCLAAAERPKQIPLWPGGAPGSEGKTGDEVSTPRKEPNIDAFPVISNIHNPSITPFLPAKGKVTGAAVIVAPGGGHRFLSIDHEGYDVAQAFADAGIAAFVLKYRLAREQGSTYTIEGHALADAQQAIRMIRSRAPEWGIKPDRLGIMGFSAGGEVAALAGTRFGDGTRPDFQVLIYPGIREIAVTKDTPPTFLLSAHDDRPAEVCAATYIALKKAGVPAELHIYTKGGHGFGIWKRPNPIATWPLRVQEWMGSLGLLN
ncbi:MAG TPA: alpha/beta hydrolase [Bryobacteraceae bacterium]|nr:alpha/beta hydrolase [Bryobacteraceae bacterium]